MIYIKANRRHPSSPLPNQALERLKVERLADPSLDCKVPVLLAAGFDVLENGDPLLNFTVEDVPPVAAVVTAVVTAVKPEDIVSV